MINMPALSPTMTQGNLGVWHKKVGDAIQPGDVLVEIETDKAQMDFECQDEGFLAKILVQGSTPDVPVNDPIGVLCENKEDVAAFAEFSLSDSGPAVDTKIPTSRAEEKKPDIPLESPKQESKVASTPSKAPSPSEQVDRILASPLAKTLSNEKGISLSEISGSGPNGRIIKVDVENYKEPVKAAPAPAPVAPKKASSAAAPTASAGDAFKDLPVSNIRKVIAQRLSESKSTIPHYYLTTEIQMDKTMKLRQILNAQANGAYKLSVNDFIIKASALALKDVPEVNSSWQESFIRQFDNADIAVAVATDNGLITPIIKNAESKGLSKISNTVKEMAARAKIGKLAPAEYNGGSFTISNLGMFNITSFSAIVNPPHAAIMAVGSVTDKLVLDDKSEKGFSVCKVCSFTISCDHRVVDGAVGAKFMGKFAEYLEDPLKMLL